MADEVEFSIIGGELLAPGRQIEIYTPRPVDPTAARSAVIIRKDGRNVFTPVTVDQKGKFYLQVDELLDNNGEEPLHYRKVPVGIDPLVCHVPGSLRVVHATHIAVGETTIEKLLPSQSALPGFIYVGFIQALHHQNGNHVSLAFDERGKEVDGKAILEDYHHRQFAKFGHLHKTVYDQLHLSNSSQDINVAIWPEFNMDLTGYEKPNVGEIIEPPAAARVLIDDAVKVRSAIVRVIKKLGARVEETPAEQLIIYASLKVSQALKLAQTDGVGQVFLDDRTGINDLGDSEAIASAIQAQALGYTGLGVHVAVFEGGPSDLTNLGSHMAMHLIALCILRTATITPHWDGQSLRHKTALSSASVSTAQMSGLAAFEGGPDWRGPLADRALISSADGGYTLNNAVRIVHEVANLGRKLAGEAPLPPPKKGAQFHFSLPGSVQEYAAPRNDLLPNLVKVEQTVDDQHGLNLAIHLNGWINAAEPVEMLTQTFTPPEILLTAVLRAESSNTTSLSANLRQKYYNAADTLSPSDGPSALLSPGQEQTLTWTIPDAFDSQPIQQLGLALSCLKGHVVGTVCLDSLCYGGSPCMTLRRPTGAQSDPFQLNPVGKPCEFWTRAWIDSLSTFHTTFPMASFYLAQDQGEGVLIIVTRDWIDYRVAVPRYYALIFKPDRKSVVLVKAKDESRMELASASYEWELDEPCNVAVCVRGRKITGIIAGHKILGAAQDSEYTGGGIIAVILDRAVAIDQFLIN
ncbi:hypothetical protein VE00_10742 [Pseudogymnoascus sp. WSF 3629]|nr:hypothetical protein VE00_10742 [Pseudogymnoascus sp. WSF 3629]